ncbi:hypothetical protein [Paenarthrobacter histidinolovorans]|uniref:Uncharacterized protein n=1 Tax=Paenarthrobacter histidinolovorans TaxID=43664 RepID=A0ABW8NBR0_9MICC|nr:hypothetical protein [Paenarthrobacter histidinolovorans]GGJ38324.1 hypothetical protein GCM10010052_39320 [Paenarthrobacter histidinolovorans]
MTAVVITGTKDATIPEALKETPDSTPSKRTGLLDLVWTAAARVEGLQWEMDEAEESLAQAMRSAVAAGAGLPDLAIASGMSFADIEQLLAQQLNGLKP